jgi:hypothetical protein
MLGMARHGAAGLGFSWAYMATVINKRGSGDCYLPGANVRPANLLIFLNATMPQRNHIEKTETTFWK